MNIILKEKYNNRRLNWELNRQILNFFKSFRKNLKDNKHTLN
jgi:hypothetical protein